MTPERTSEKPPAFRWFTPALGFLLIGYLFFNKSFAYLHIPGTPFFIGEIVMGIGLVEVVGVRSPWRLLLRTAPVLRVLLAFMALCTVRLLADLPVYKIDAIRDSSIWYYGIFAFLVAAAALREPTFVPRLLGWYRLSLPWFLLWAPVAVALAEVPALSAHTVPGSAAPLNSFKSADYALQIAIALGFYWLRLDRLTDTRPVSRRELTTFSAIGVLSLCVSLTQTRGGFVSGVLLLAIVLVFVPAGRRRVLTFSVGSLLVLSLAGALVTNVKIHNERRDVSVTQLGQNLLSLAGKQETEELSGTVQWRQGYWQQIVTDLTRSHAWVTGVGFGPILPERYEVVIDASNPLPLRNAHNTHLTILARTGFFGFGLWALTWVVACGRMTGWLYRRRRRARDPDVALVVWLFAALPAFLVNAVFDPALDGPQAAIWFFVLVGLGATSTRVRRPPSAPGVPRPPGRVRRRLAAWWARGRHVVTRLGWGVADQGVSSLTNFAVGVYVARELGPGQFGAFSLAFATYALSLNAARGLATDPLVVRFSDASPESRHGALARSMGASVAVGVATGLCALAVGLLLRGETGAAFVALGLTLPGLMLQDGWRYTFFSGGRGQRAFVNDLVWGLALAVTLSAAVVSGRTTVFWFVLAWGSAACVAALVGIVQAGVVPRVSWALVWLREHRDLGPRYLGENLSFSGAGQLRFYGLAAIASLAAVGSLRAAELLVGPVTVLITGVAVMAVPEVVRMLRRSVRYVRAFCLAIGVLWGGSALAWGLVLMFVVPNSVGHAVLGPTWTVAAPLILPTTLTVAFFGLGIGAWVGLRGLGAAKRSLPAQLVSASLYLIGALTGGALAAASGAAWGTAVASLAGAGIYWAQFGRALRDEHVRAAGEAADEAAGELAVP